MHEYLGMRYYVEGLEVTREEFEAHIAEQESIEEETCEHGLSAWLCEGPTHYPVEY